MWDILYNITIMPIQMLVEFVFSFMYKMFYDEGTSIIFVSIIIQLMVYPMYKKADELQEKEREKQKEMQHWVKHIKKTFKGDERFMMLQAYYKIKDYNPAAMLKGSLSLLLQIPFFMAAYNYISHLNMIKGKSFFVIKDLGKPDEMLLIAGITINLLPILMTLINIVSGMIYTKGFLLKDKLQLYIMALVFLVLLYNSPSGLVLYWTMNNLFSLFKNIYAKLIKEKRIVINLCCALLGAFIYAFGAKYYVALSCLILGMIPTVLSLFETFFTKSYNRIKEVFKSNRKYSEKEIIILDKSVFLGLCLLSVFLGIFIPMTVIGSSPTEFISTNYGPFKLLLYIFSVYIGIFLVWFNLVYHMMNERGRRGFATVLFVVAVTGIISVFGFGKELGVVSTSLVYDETPVIKDMTLIISTMLFVLTAAVAIWIYKRKPAVAKFVYEVIFVTMIVLSVTKIVPAKKELDKYVKPETNKVGEYDKIFNLSKSGQNVVVIMLDRAVGTFVPYLVEEKPELKEMFDGFTYYPNTLSYGGHTNFAAPALFGGYEYTPEAMNEKSEISLKEKHNQSLLVMPVLFGKEGYDVTIADPPYANYKWNSDLSLYNNYPEMKAYITQGAYSAELADAFSGCYESKQKRNFIYYSIMKASPVMLQEYVYDYGYYFDTSASVTSEAFISWYSVLENMKELTQINDDGGNNLLLIQNSATHDTVYFNAPDYDEIADFSYFSEQKKLETIEGVDGIKLDTPLRVTHYQTDMASLLRIGEWLEYLKENGVYDNTRIIIVSDHGKDLGQFDSMILPDGTDTEKYNPLLMYKDFNAKGFNISNEFMTNADTCILAMEDIVENPVNPFTGKEINDDDKHSKPQKVTSSRNYSIYKNNGNVFDTSDGNWYEIKDDIFDLKNWKKIKE